MLRRFVLSVLIVAMPVGVAARVPREVAEKSGDPRDKMICKRFPVTGSLVKVYRNCQTKRDWDRERDNLRVLGVTQSCSLMAEGGSCR